ncbi:MAG: GspH/FimT family pseudopilin [Magnetococcales bacterium]|nr:GspH/FimT family pseudopilin [Magnetococcales bacterium]MBF0322516.1 GspH/FimT family pseudopilin [Magnetococcales bacterium]
MRDESGLSLVELLIMVLTIGILTSSGYVTFSQGNISLRAKAEQFAQDIRYAQTLAMNRGASYQVNVNGSSYTITTSADTAGLLSQATLSGVTIGGTYPIVFNGLGQPTNAGVKTLTTGNQTISINVRAESGSVVVP